MQAKKKGELVHVVVWLDKGSSVTQGMSLHAVGLDYCCGPMICVYNIRLQLRWQ